MREEDIWLLVSARQQAFTSIHAVMDAGVPVAALERLADADAFRSMGLDRRQALWEISALGDKPVGIFKGQSADAVEVAIKLPEMSPAEHVVQDYGSTALSLKAHPVSFVREKLRQLKVSSTSDLSSIANGTMIRLAGLVLIRQRPGTATGICFITIEDESGVANLVVFSKLFDKYRSEILRSRLLMVEGKVQREGEVIHVVVRSCHNFSHLLQGMTASDEEQASSMALPAGNTDKFPAHISPGIGKKPVQIELFPKGRNFK